MIKTLSILKALADETRLRLCTLLHRFEFNVGELVDIFGMGQSRISRHLRILTDCGLATFRRDGLWVFYSGAPQGLGREIFAAMLPYLEDEPLFAGDRVRAEAVMAERSRATRLFFDTIAGDWEGLRNEVLGGLDLIQAIVSRVTPCGALLDMGCGTGELLCALRSKAQRLIGVDSSQKMLETARRNLAHCGAEVSLRIGELEHLPLRDGEVDLAVASMALHHLSEPERGIEEACRVLAPDGRMIIAEFLKHDLETMRFSHKDRWLGFGQEQMEEWLASAGLSLEACTRHPVNHGLVVLLLQARKTNLLEDSTHDSRSTA